MSVLSGIPPDYVLIAGFFLLIGLLVGYMIATWRRNGKH
jgi:hypothetical protein